MDITFNTGRLYAKNGQVIRAVWDQGAGTIHFNDHSRMIVGTVLAPDQAFDDERRLATYLMRRYDDLEYRWTVEAAALGRNPEATIHEFRI